MNRQLSTDRGERGPANVGIDRVLDTVGRHTPLATRCTGSVEHLADGVSMTAVALGEFADLGAR